LQQQRTLGEKHEDLAKLGIENFDEYMKHILLKKEGNMNKILSDKIDGIMDYVKSYESKLVSVEKERDELRKKLRY